MQFILQFADYLWSSKESCHVWNSLVSKYEVRVRKLLSPRTRSVSIDSLGISDKLRQLPLASLLTSASGVYFIRPLQCHSGLLSLILSVFFSFLFIVFSAKKHKATFIKQDQNFPLKHDQVLLQKLSSFLPLEWFSTLDIVFCILRKSSIKRCPLSWSPTTLSESPLVFCPLGV